MAKRDFVFGPDGEMLPSDSTVAADRRREMGGNVSTSKAAEPKKETFREAFARNRAAGKDTFTWNGKKYSTEMAKPAAKPAAKTAAKVEPPSARTTARTAAASMGRPGPTKERAAAMPPMARKPDASTSRGVRATETKPATKPAEARKPLAKSEGFQRQIERDEAKREQRREFGRQRDAEKKADSKPSLRSQRTERMQKESQAERDAASKMSPAERSAARGRKVKEFFGMASGGAVSKRADGIAKKGKTKCKII